MVIAIAVVVRKLGYLLIVGSEEDGLRENLKNIYKATAEEKTSQKGKDVIHIYTGG